VSGNEAVLVFYRESGEARQALNVWVDGRVAGTLQPGRFALTRACAGSVALKVAGSGQPMGEAAMSRQNVPGGRTVFFRIGENAQGRFEAQQVTEATARGALSDLKISHVIDRHVVECVPARADGSAFVLRRVELSADALFAFDGSGVQDIAQQGLNRLDALKQEIRVQGLQVLSLRITGHSDRLGGDAYNEQLSLARAATVAEYLRRRGLDIPMSTQGRGALDPVSTGCVGAQVTPELIRCLSPDRRVTVDLIGQVPAKP
jgi:outer membrane protein OmpA-like peptidoglycan-associated protein